MRYLNAAQAARILGIGDKTIRRWLKEGKKLPSAIRQANGEYAIPEEEVESLRQHRLTFSSSPQNVRHDPSEVTPLAEKIAQLEREMAALKSALPATEKAEKPPVSDSMGEESTPSKKNLDGKRHSSS